MDPPYAAKVDPWGELERAMIDNTFGCFVVNCRELARAIPEFLPITEGGPGGRLPLTRLGDGVGPLLRGVDSLLSSMSLAIALPGDRRQSSVMRQPIQCGARQKRISEQLSPFLWSAVAREENAPPLVTPLDDLVKVFRSHGRDRAQTEVVEDQ